MIEELKKKIEECESRLDSEDGIYLDNLVHSYPKLNINDERILFGLYKNTKDKNYKDIIFKCHLRDVYETCDDKSDYRPDLISEGTLFLYKYIDCYDYDLSYPSFKENLTARLKLLYWKLTENNNKSLDTKMSTHELKCLEERGKCLTDTNEVEEPDIKTNKEDLIIVTKKKNFMIKNNRTIAIFKNIFGDDFEIKPKKLKYRKKYKPSDMEY